MKSSRRIRTTRALGVRDLDVPVDLAERRNDALVRVREVARLERGGATTAQDDRLCVPADDRDLLQLLLLHAHGHELVASRDVIISQPWA